MSLVVVGPFSLQAVSHHRKYDASNFLAHTNLIPNDVIVAFDLRIIPDMIFMDLCVSKVLRESEGLGRSQRL